MSNQTLGFYATNAARYAARGAVNPRLLTFLDLLQPAARVLELGTGSGHDARYMLDRGFDVDPTDGSPELADVASNMLGRTVRPLMFEEIAGEQVYDGVYASASILHAPARQLPGIVWRIHRSLKTGGTAWASFKDGTAEGIDAHGRFYNYMSAEALLAIWRTVAPWDQLVVDTWDGSAYENVPTRWHAVIATR
jgi:SAM-dependent methyltransferase